MKTGSGATFEDSPSFSKGVPRKLARPVSWPAIIAGAIAAAALSLVLLILGTGLGLSAVSPWSNEGMSGASFGISTILWVTLTQIAAAGLGGYLTGRLRTRWENTHPDEVYFRDTAHGFLAWATASLLTAALLGSVIGTIVSGGVKAGASVGVAAASAGAASLAGSDSPSSAHTAYFVDSVFRKDGMASNLPQAAHGEAMHVTPPESATAASVAEIAHIFAKSMRSDSLPPTDLRYAARVVAQHTGMSQAEAEKRVGDAHARMRTELSDMETQTRNAADEARKASAYVALWLFISLLIGAFAASFAATYGGRHRDNHLWIRPRG